MPHLIIEYSANLDRAVDIPALAAAVHRAALDTGVFPIGGTRTRTLRHDVYAIADSHPENAFVHIQVRIAKGRAADVREAAAAGIFDAVKRLTAAAFAVRPLALSLEIVEMEPVGAQKHNNLHEAVAARAAKI